MRFYILLFTALLLSTSALTQTNLSSETQKRITDFENNVMGDVMVNDDGTTIYDRMRMHNVKGISIAVIKDYKIDWAKGYGWADEEEKRPVTENTIFHPGSISKALHAVGILKLAQEGKVDLYTDINEYLTSWKFPYDSLSKGKKITLAHLLSHTAGLTMHGGRGSNRNAKIPTVYDILDGEPPAITSSRIQGGSLMMVPPVRSTFEPGLKYEYSGGGTLISQVLLQDVTGQKYAPWMYENVLKPIGMSGSFFDQFPPKNKLKHCASGYYKDGSKVLRNFHVSPTSAGGLWMTPTELCSYIIDMQLAYKGGKSKVLSPEMVKLHLTPYANSKFTSLGCFIEDRNGHKYFQHEAGNDGFCGKFYGSLEDGFGIVVFVNSEEGKLVEEVISSIGRVYQWKDFYGESKRKTAITVPDDSLKGCEGVYLWDSLWTGIIKRNNQLYQYGHVWQNYKYFRMYFTSPSTFFNKELTSIKTFIKKNNEVIAFSRNFNGEEISKAIKVTNPDTLNLSSQLFTDIGWFFLENKRYDDAIVYFRRGNKLYPEDLNLTMSMGHAYLFKHDYKNAISIYKAHLKEKVNESLVWEELLSNDLIYFTEYHYDVKPFDLVFKDLKLKKPKGY